MKTKPKPLEKSDRGFDSNSFWRHYVATVDSDQGWDEERPQQGRGSNRLFLFLLLFHIFLIGSVVLYNLVSERPKPVFVDNSAPTRTTAAPTKKSPAPVSPAPDSGVITASKTTETVEHRVAHGDSLKTIADASGATQEEIARLNEIDVNTQLAVGSVLRVPPPKVRPLPTVIPTGNQPSRVDENIVTVQTTTAAETARMFAAVEPAPAPKPVETIASKLPEETPKPKVADTLPPAVIPNAPTKIEEAPPAAKPTESKAVARTVTPPATTPKVAAPVKPAPAPAPAKPAASTITHTVKPKETFYSISRKYGVNVDELMRINGVTDPGKLREGVVLKVPAKN